MKNLLIPPKDHKRSLTLAARVFHPDQPIEAFQSIIEEPAENNQHSVENKSLEDKRDTSQSAIVIQKKSIISMQKSVLSNNVAARGKSRENSQVDDDKSPLKLNFKEY